MRLLGVHPVRCALRSLSGTALIGGDVETSQVPGKPCLLVAAFSGPGRGDAQLAICAAPPAAEPAGKGARPQREVQFRGSIARPLRSLSTLRRVDSSTATQDSLLACWLGFWPCGSRPEGFSREFQVIIGLPLSLAPSFS